MERSRERTEPGIHEENAGTNERTRFGDRVEAEQIENGEKEGKEVHAMALPQRRGAAANPYENCSTAANNQNGWLIQMESGYT